jgi:SAM-dependent methyltransferase
MEALNRRTWGTHAALSWYGKVHGYLDAGERACLDSLRETARGRPLLDLGVGGGRTTAVLLPLVSRYVGLDHTPEMLAICRRKFPGVDVREGDARDLSDFPDGSFEVVVFSFNGLDLVHEEGRAAILHEVRRVLVPGGTFYFSTIHRDGPDFRQRQLFPRLALTPNPLRLAKRALFWIGSTLLGWSRLLRYQRFEEHHVSHSILLHQAHSYGLLVYATTLPELRRQLAATGFERVEILGARSGCPVDGQEANEPYLHVIARKPR